MSQSSSTTASAALLEMSSASNTSGALAVTTRPIKPLGPRSDFPRGELFDQVFETVHEAREDAMKYHGQASYIKEGRSEEFRKQAEAGGVKQMAEKLAVLAANHDDVGHPVNIRSDFAEAGLDYALDPEQVDYKIKVDTPFAGIAHEAAKHFAGSNFTPNTMKVGTAMLEIVSAHETEKIKENEVMGALQNYADASWAEADKYQKVWDDLDAQEKDIKNQKAQVADKIRVAEQKPLQIDQCKNVFEEVLKETQDSRGKRSYEMAYGLATSGNPQNGRVKGLKKALGMNEETTPDELTSERVLKALKHTLMGHRFIEIKMGINNLTTLPMDNPGSALRYMSSAERRNLMAKLQQAEDEDRNQGGYMIPFGGPSSSSS